MGQCIQVLFLNIFLILVMTCESIPNNALHGSISKYKRSTGQDFQNATRLTHSTQIITADSNLSSSDPNTSLAPNGVRDLIKDENISSPSTLDRTGRERRSRYPYFFRRPHPILPFVHASAAVEILPWAYNGPLGPNLWPFAYPSCGGDKQSPIDIITSNAVGQFPFHPVRFRNYNVMPYEVLLKNNGHTAHVVFRLPSPARLEGGDLGNEYAFIQLDFHWGADDTRGSEHTIDGVRYAGELHLYHYKIEYGTIEEALQHDDGIAVLAVLIQIGPERNPKFDSIIDSLSQVHIANTETYVTPFPLQYLLPTNLDEFYRYSGSLTTPTCKEVVVWTVFKEAVTLSSHQIRAFRALRDINQIHLVDNFRPVQPLNNRQVTKGISVPHWAYTGSLEPSLWANYFPMCGGRNQSPVNIVTRDALDNFSWPKFKFSNYNELSVVMTIVNNGHTAQLSEETSTPPTLEGGGLEGEYTFSQLHFHWGINDSVGSEHTVDGQHFVSELHLVHYKTSYGNVSEAMKYPDGVAVLGIFLQISAHDNLKLTSLVNGIARIEDADSKATIMTFALLDLFPQNTHDFYRYHGSLTTPTCNEAVIWTLFKEPIKISERQITIFRNLLDEEDHLLSDNYRPPQPLNDRKIFSATATCPV